MCKKWLRNSVLMGLGLAMVAPAMSWGYGEASVIQAYVARDATLPLIKPSWGNFILHTDKLNSFYALRGYQAAWVDSNGRPGAMATSLRQVLLSVARHGLNPRDYWDLDVENLFKAAQSNQKNWITFEMAATEALIRYADHLSNGRFDPEAVDQDIKFKKRTFNEYQELVNAVNSGASGLSPALDQFAPQHSRYKDLLEVLARLRQLKDQGGWPMIAYPGTPIKMGVTNPAIAQLRTRLKMLGYPVSDNGNQTFDEDFDAGLRLYQEKNGLAVDGVIAGARSEVLRSLNYNVGQRIAQVEATIEKIRWLPKTMEPRHIFVNLATAEFRLFEEGQLAMNFKTIVGQSFRRTPSMKDAITYVDLNPLWTVPNSIALKDKLPMIKANVNYLDAHNMSLFDARTHKEVSPYEIDWKTINSSNFAKYYIRQKAGPDNALGVVKFPLQNPWAIYMHDTNERSLFKESRRHISSGCVRLEQPLELAAHLLRDQPGWSLSEIQAFVPQSRADKPVEVSKKVSLKKSMPVYFLYLTVEKADNGAIRFVDDVYGQDTRLAKALANKKNQGELF